MEGDEILKLVVEKIKVMELFFKTGLFFKTVESGKNHSKKEDPRAVADMVSFEMKRYAKAGMLAGTLMFGYKNISRVDFCVRPSIRWVDKTRPKNFKLMGHVPMPEAWEFADVESCEDMYQNMVMEDICYLGETAQSFCIVDLSRKTQHEEDLDSIVEERPSKLEEADMISDASEVSKETAIKLVEIARKVRIEFRERKIKGTGCFSRTLSTDRLIIAAKQYKIGGVETLNKTIINLFGRMSIWNDGSSKEEDSERHRIKLMVIGKFGDL